MSDRKFDPEEIRRVGEAISCRADIEAMQTDGETDGNNAVVTVFPGNFVEHVDNKFSGREVNATAPAQSQMNGVSLR